MDLSILTAEEQLAYITGDEDVKRAYDMRFMAMCDETSNRNFYLQQGRSEERLEIARKMRGMGDSPEKILAITGLSPDVYSC